MKDKYELYFLTDSSHFKTEDGSRLKKVFVILQQIDLGDHVRGVFDNQEALEQAMHHIKETWRQVQQTPFPEDQFYIDEFVINGVY